MEALFAGLITVMKRSISRDRGKEIAYQGERGAENPFRMYGREGLLAFNAIPSLVELSSVGAPLFASRVNRKNRPLDTESDNSEKKEAGRLT